MLRYLGSGLIFGLCLMGNALAQSPEEVAARCAHKIEQIVERAKNAAIEETHHCVRRINELIDQGHHEAAAEVVRRCIHSATVRTHDAVRRVNEICDECIAVLTRLHAPELARRIRHLCDEAIANLREILEREKNAILDALG
jgi:Arc/MetJ-type ribon-helix-helix transcriptional regulator